MSSLAPILDYGYNPIMNYELKRAVSVGNSPLLLLYRSVGVSITPRSDAAAARRWP